MFNEIKLLARQIEASFAGSTTEVKAFDSGSATLDVRWQGRLFVLDYSKAMGVGVDEVGEDEAFGTGYRFTVSFRQLSIDATDSPNLRFLSYSPAAHVSSHCGGRG
jgi:hypothetical protein